MEWLTQLVDDIDADADRRSAFRRLRPGQTSALGFNQPGQVSLTMGPIRRRLVDRYGRQ